MLDTDTYRTQRRRPPTRFFPLEAEELLRDGQVENATELCKRGLIYFPDNIPGYAVLAQAYVRLGQEERALNVLEDGYRRTGAEGLESLRRIITGERPAAPVDQRAETIAAESEPAEQQIEEEETPVAESAMPAEPGAESLEQSMIEGPVTIESEALPYTAEPIEEAFESLRETEPEEPEGATEIPAAGESEQVSDREMETVLDGSARDAARDEADLTAESEEEAIEEEPFAIADAEEEVQARPVEEELMEEPEGEEEPAEPESETVRVKATVRGLGSIETGEEEPDTGRPTTPAFETRQTMFAHGGSAQRESGRRETKPVEPKELTSGRGVLSIHSGTKISRLSSSNLRLIPGLEFAPLRRDDELKMRIAPLINEPPPGFSFTFDPIIPGLSDEPGEKPASAGVQPMREDIRETAGLPGRPAREERPDVDPSEPADAAESVDDVDLFPDIPEAGELDSLAFGSGSSSSQTDHATEPGHDAMTPLEELARRLETARIPIVEEDVKSYQNPAFEPSIISDTFAAILVGQGAYAEAIKAYQMLAVMKPERRGEYERKIEDVRRKMGG